MSLTTPFELVPRLLTALRERRPTRVLGVDGGFRGLVLARAMADPRAEGPLVYVAQDAAAAQAVAADAAFFAGIDATDFGPERGRAILVVPAPDVSPYADASPDPRNVAARLGCLEHIRCGQARLVVLSVRTLMSLVIPLASFETHRRIWSKGESIERSEAVAALDRAGYRRVDVVEDPGTFAVRGAVLDVFTAIDRFPTRIEFFGDEIERLRRFDAETQRSLREVDDVVLVHARETIGATAAHLRPRILALGDEVEAPSSRTRQVVENVTNGVDFFGIEALTPLYHDALVPLWTFFPTQTRWYVDDAHALPELAQRLALDYAAAYDRRRHERDLVCPPQRFFCEVSTLQAKLEQAAVLGDRIDVYEPDGDDGRARVRCRVERNLALKRAVEAARGQRGGELLRPLVDRIRQLDRDGGWEVVLVAPNTAHADRLSGMLRGYGLSIKSRDGEGDEPILDAEREVPNHAARANVRLLAGTLSDGFCAPDDRVLVVSESEIFGRVTRTKQRRRKRAGLASLSQLHVGDYVVHSMHGVGRYHGLVRLPGKAMDFVHLEYASQQKLYLPVYRVNEVERYLSAEAKEPKLDKMGGQTFAAKTGKVKAEVRQMAEELLVLYAEREAMGGHAYPEPDDMYAQFEATFPFEETPDQLDAIEAVQRDLTREQPMDRIVCGDVGFGKTEVALRAAFRAASSGKQVAVLAPTTVLVQQHFLTFTDRMSVFPLKVGVLNRFQSGADRRRVVEGVRSGQIDIVVGTHRLLSKDVRFRDLGLVIIDEEQRFGVAQKERFKKLKAKVDVLTLTATPIPRTLHMGLLGLREVSLILTAPANRLAVKTYLTRSSDAVLEEGIRREIARGGQVFYVVPRVLGIEEHAVRIRELVPDARVVVAHGQMPPDLLERTMFDFIEHRADVLISTTIIESGLDIPRANTMFIARADNFGLSQLYQLRGRIGRSRLRAHCYLMVNSLEKLNPEAKRRLEAIQRHTDLGSGFNVASEDLEIRGAGDILGKRQAGSIAAVGFEAYARLLEEAVAELRGDPITRDQDPELSFSAPAFLPDTYVEDTGQRLEFYRRLSAADDVDDVHDTLAELHDRFGELPDEVRNLGLVMACKAHGRRLRATALELVGHRFSVRLGSDTPLTGGVAARLEATTGGRFRLDSGTRIVVRIAAELADEREQLEACERALAELGRLSVAGA
ncbi:MAG: transcription-repair coupling factor [Myxococcales bacterium FL481]|nr:MAG: transcription-repair coupling factor [Myxococcales bacterium FL481]